MDYRTYEWRIGLSLIVLLVLIQVAGFFAVQRSNRSIATNVVETELHTASLVVLRMLNLRHQQLAQSASVLASDFGLRETLTSGDVPTIKSMLNNHGKRIGADLVVLSALDGNVLASVAPGLHGYTPNLDTLQLKGNQGHMHVRILPHDGIHTAFQFVTVPVLTPEPSARLSMGFAIDDAFLKDLRELIDLEVSVLSRDVNGVLHVLCSTLVMAQRQSLITNLPNEVGPSMWEGSLGEEEFQILTLPLSETGQMDLQLVLGVSLELAMAPYKRIEKVVGALILIGLLLSGLAVQLVTRRMVAPLNAMAHLDGLTGLANRRLLNIALKQAELVRQHRSIPYSLLMFDLDRFKALNDTYGHAAGDKVLQTVAERLHGSVRDTDTICRQGGDEFVILLCGADQQAAERVAQKILDELAIPIDFEGHALEVGGSIGIAVAKPGPLLQVKQVMDQADEAMYAAKRSSSGFVTAAI